MRLDNRRVTAFSQWFSRETHREKDRLHQRHRRRGNTPRFGRCIKWRRQQCQQARRGQACLGCSGLCCGKSPEGGIRAKRNQPGGYACTTYGGAWRYACTWRHACTYAIADAIADTIADTISDSGLDLTYASSLDGARFGASMFFMEHLGAAA